MCTILDEDDEEEVVGSLPSVTIRDVAHLAPDVGIAGMEPNGWMVVGLPTNFFADTSVGIVATSILGRQAEVRFTPVAFSWNFGDGSRLTTGDGGATWAQQGLGEFSPTRTSHVYSRAGSYTVELTVDFTAEYRFGVGSWQPLDGTVPAVANRVEGLARDAKTVLVPGECRVNPRSPGC